MRDVKQIAIVSESEAVPFDEVAVVAAALQRQMIEHVALCWDVTAIVNAYRRLDNVPPHYWPILVVDQVDGSAGIHEDDRGQPFSLVAVGPSWSLAASHECIEMLVDPFGKTLHPGPAPILRTRPGAPQVEFLVEVCDPCEGEQFAYQIDGILVSDFYTRDYFARTPVAGLQYSFNNQIGGPREVLEGGYLTWRDPLTGQWGQLTRAGGAARFVDLGVLMLGGRSIRQAIRGVSGRHYDHLSGAGRDVGTMASALRTRRAVDEAGRVRAEALRWQVDEMRRHRARWTSGA